MTTDITTTVLSSIIVAVLPGLVLGIAGAVTILIGLGTTRLRTWLDARGQAAASQVVADASTRLQAAAQNSAGAIALAIQTGTLDPTSMGALRQAASTEAVKIAAKLPDALATLKPVEGALVDMVLGKLGTLATQAAGQGMAASATK